MNKKLKLGSAFSDQVRKVSYTSGHFHKNKGSGLDWQDSLIGGNDERSTQTLSSWRKLFLSLIVILTFSTLFFKLFELQIIHGKENNELADSNRIQVKVIHAPRGVIYDRNGKVLAQNEPGFRLLEKNDKGEVKVSQVTRDDFLKMDVGNDPRLKDLEIDSIRTYPLAEKTSHILGYTSEITEEELKDQSSGNDDSIAQKLLPTTRTYKLGDKVGRGGIEESYEKVLRGIDGGEVIEVDAGGKKVRTLRKTDPIPGQNIYLSIDADMQALAFKLVEDAAKKVGSCCGSVVAQDPNTGEILLSVSYPSFDPKDISQALVNPNAPLLNRVIGGTYPPGSTFKIASALAGLETGKITPTTQFEDTGIMSLGPFTFANWYFSEYGRKEGSVDIIKALKRSNDIFFYQVGQSIGEGELGNYAKKTGLGKKLGIDIPGEVSGLIPDDAWKEKNVGDVWYPGDTLHMAIGQGFVLTTPLQINNLVSLIAANGKQFPPHLAQKITGPDGNTIKEFRFDAAISNAFKPENISLVRTGLEEVPKEGGTAWPFFPFPFSTAGKTGTAEFGDGKKTHAWYTAYAPSDSPKIAATAMIEGGGEGSTVASPIIKELFRYFLSSDKSNLVKDVGQIATDSARTLGE